MALTKAPSLLPTVRVEATKSSNGTPSADNHSPILLSRFSKPSWVVRTQSNVRLERRQKPEPPCVLCEGTGRVDCRYCHGKGRTNNVQLAMLPKGEWPKWCRACGGSGLCCCPRCLGTGEFRYPIGFHFAKRDSDETHEQKQLKIRDNLGNLTASDFLLNDKQADGSSGK